MRAPKKMEQLKCKDRGSERKERELNHRFPMLCVTWQQCLLLACGFQMGDFLQSVHLPCLGEALQVPALGATVGGASLHWYLTLPSL